MATRIQLRRDTAANWESVNPVLREAEIGVDLTGNEDGPQIRVGDGITAWNDLIPIAAGAGAEGPQGPAGPAGADGEPGADGEEVEIRVDSDNIEWRRGTGDWELLVELSTLTGPAGATGATGAAGATGATGAAGADGKTWHSGSGVPSGGTGANGDFYLDTAASAWYGPKTAGAWGSAHSLVGATGATGAAGATGATGPAGADGDDGLNGESAPQYILYNGTSWPSRASATPAGYTGIMIYFSVGFPAAPNPLDMEDGDLWWGSNA